MKRVLRAAFAAPIAAFALSLAACSAEVAPSAPATPDVSAAAEQPSANLLDLGGTLSGVGETLSGTLSNLTLFKCSSLDYGSTTRSVGPLGGTIRVGPHILVVPAGALDRPVSITASAPAGEHVAVEFEPEGLSFRKPAILRLSYAHCDYRPLVPRVVYVDDVFGVLELLPSLSDLRNKSVTTGLRHFSGYAIAD